MTGVQRILILRISVLGDVVHVLLVLTALRCHFLGARIGWVVEEAMAPILDGHPDLDELLVLRFRAWRRRPLALRTLADVAVFVGALRRFRADAVLDLMGNHKGALIAVTSGAGRRIGLARPDRHKPSSTLWISDPVTLAPSTVHAVDRALAVAAALGIPRCAADFGGAKLFSGAPPAAAAADLAAPGGAAEAPFVLLHPGAG